MCKTPARTTTWTGSKMEEKKNTVSSLLCELPTAMRNLTFVAILYIPYIIWLANQ